MNDLISRQSVEDAIYEYSRSCDVNYAQIMKYIDKLPSVNPQEPRAGEWQQDLDGTCLCSECGSGFKEQPTLMGKPMFLWCPLCGARMERSDKESEEYGQAEILRPSDRL